VTFRIERRAPAPRAGFELAAAAGEGEGAAAGSVKRRAIIGSAHSGHGPRQVTRFGSARVVSS
jgi:hypothetical protein